MSEKNFFSSNLSLEQREKRDKNFFKYQLIKSEKYI
jgi:hypothetical protein